jgi:DNA-directed RNA polymerase subunit RPC12/RpoP
MLFTNNYPCSRCGTRGTQLHREVTKQAILTWYACPHCRHRYRTTADGQGYNAAITAESPHEEGKRASLVALNVHSPCCNALGKVRDTWRDERGYFRRHLCRSCNKSFYTCTADDGNVTRYPVRPATPRKQFDIT